MVAIAEEVDRRELRAVDVVPAVQSYGQHVWTGWGQTRKDACAGMFAYSARSTKGQNVR